MVLVAVLGVASHELVQLDALAVLVQLVFAPVDLREATHCALPLQPQPVCSEFPESLCPDEFALLLPRTPLGSYPYLWVRAWFGFPIR